MMILSCGHQIEKNRTQIKQIWSLFIYNTLSYYKKSSILHNTFLTCSTQSRIMSPHDSTKIILLSENESKRHTHIPKWKKKKVQAYMLKHFCFTLKHSPTSMPSCALFWSMSCLSLWAPWHLHTFWTRFAFTSCICYSTSPR